MWTFLSALAGGLIALLGSVGTTYYVQQQAVKVERRARATRAADEIRAAVTALHGLPREPEMGAPGSPDMMRYQEWRDKKESLVYQIQAQAILIPAKDLRERLTFVARAMLQTYALERYESLSELQARYVLCAEALDCLGAYYQHEALPPERATTTGARSAIAEAMDEE
jgi:hypothetical protein